MLSVDELIGGSHTGIHGHRIQTMKILRQACRQEPVLGIWGGLLERSELVLAFVLLFLAAVVAIRPIRPIAAIVCSTMSGHGLAGPSRGGECNILCEVIRSGEGFVAVGADIWSLLGVCSDMSRVLVSDFTTSQ